MHYLEVEAPSELVVWQNYRQGNYQIALDLYNQLLDSSDPVMTSHTADYSVR